jgi:site-specific recombinase XerD
MPQKLETVLKHVEEIGNYVNRQLIKDYHKYLVSRDTSTIYQKDNVKLIYMFAKFIGESKTLYDIKDQEPIVAFLDTRKKTKEEDPEQRWSTTWNDYLWRLKMFYRWIYNVKIQSDNHQNYDNISNWITPDFVNINKNKIKR